MTARYTNPADKTDFGQTLVVWHEGLAKLRIHERLIINSLFGRFTVHYQQLVTLPSKGRRALQKQCLPGYKILAKVSLVCLVKSGPKWYLVVL